MRSKAALVCMAMSLVPAAVRAHGAVPPQVHTLNTTGGQDSRLVSETTFGLLVSPDKGGSWTWVCEEAIGSPPNQHSAVHLTLDGAILVGAANDLFMT